MKHYKIVRPRYKTSKAIWPDQAGLAYNFPQATGGEKVAILELGGSYNVNDINAYCDQRKYKRPTLIDVLVDGATKVSDPQGADGEVGLDICVVAAIAQGATIYVVFAPNTDQGFIDGIAKCIDLAPHSISISWGSPSDTWSSSTKKTLDTLFQKAINAGIIVFAASGDNASSDGETGNHVDYPAESPYVVGCGGTHLELNSDGSRSVETAWSLASDGTGSGGGISTVYPKPAYQSAINLSGRGVPDVSGNADPNTGFLVMVNGVIQQIGGTSGVAPLYAALCAVIKNNKVDWHIPIYQDVTDNYDVVSGTNGTYRCGTGYDCVTGVGVLDGTRFMNSLNGVTNPPVPINPQPPVTPQKSFWQKLLDILTFGAL